MQTETAPETAADVPKPPYTVVDLDYRDVKRPTKVLPGGTYGDPLNAEEIRMHEYVQHLEHENRVLKEENRELDLDLDEYRVDPAHPVPTNTQQKLADLNDRWQKAVGMPLEEAERLASVNGLGETITAGGETNAPEAGTNQPAPETKGKGKRK